MSELSWWLGPNGPWWESIAGVLLGGVLGIIGSLLVTRSSDKRKAQSEIQRGWITQVQTVASEFSVAAIRFLSDIDREREELTTEEEKWSHLEAEFYESTQARIQKVRQFTVQVESLSSNLQILGAGRIADSAAALTKCLVVAPDALDSKHPDYDAWRETATGLHSHFLSEAQTLSTSAATAVLGKERL